MTGANNIIEIGNFAFFAAAEFLWHNSQPCPLSPQKTVSEKQQIVLVSPDDLLLDEQNPRLVGFLPVKTGQKTSQDDLLRVIWENMSINELAISIDSGGFYGHEPLLVEPLNEEGKHVVIEGNRRLATVRLLLDKKLRRELKATDLPLLKDEQLQALNRLPVWVVSRKDAWQAVGFKHVHGARRWTSYAKAEYVASLRNERNLGLKEIAKKIGDNYNTVHRLHRTLMAIRQAEKAKVFDRDDRWNKHFSFSHFYNGIAIDGISEFIGLSSGAETPDDDDAPIPKGKEKELGELLVWLYGSRKDEREPVVKSQNPDLRRLGVALAKKDGVEMLRARLPLDKAVDAADGDRAVLSDCLLHAEAKLEKALGKTAGYKDDPTIERAAVSIYRLARNLLELMGLRDGSPRDKGRDGK